MVYPLDRTPPLSRGTRDNLRDHPTHLPPPRTSSSLGSFLSFFVFSSCLSTLITSPSPHLPPPRTAPRRRGLPPPEVVSLYRQDPEVMSLRERERERERETEIERERERERERESERRGLPPPDSCLYRLITSLGPAGRCRLRALRACTPKVNLTQDLNLEFFTVRQKWPIRGTSVSPRRRRLPPPESCLYRLITSPGPGQRTLIAVQGSGFRVQGSGFREQGSGLLVRAIQPHLPRPSE